MTLAPSLLARASFARVRSHRTIARSSTRSAARLVAVVSCTAMASAARFGRHRRRRGRVRPHRRVQTPRRGALGGSPGGAGTGGRAMLLHPRGRGPRRLLGVAPRRERRAAAASDRGCRGCRRGFTVGCDGGGRAISRGRGDARAVRTGRGAHGGRLRCPRGRPGEGAARGRRAHRSRRREDRPRRIRRIRDVTVHLEDGEETRSSRAASSSRCRLGSSPPPSRSTRRSRTTDSRTCAPRRRGRGIGAKSSPPSRRRFGAKTTIQASRSGAGALARRAARPDVGVVGGCAPRARRGGTRSRASTLAASRASGSTPPAARPIRSRKESRGYQRGGSSRSRRGVRRRRRRRAPARGVPQGVDQRRTHVGRWRRGRAARRRDPRLRVR